jgi:hypothetical protein
MEANVLMLDKYKSKGISILILSFALSIYSVVFKPMWDQYLMSNGHVVGVGETMVGYALCLTTATIIGYFFTRRRKSEE